MNKTIRFSIFLLGILSVVFLLFPVTTTLADSGLSGGNWGVYQPIGRLQSPDSGRLRGVAVKDGYGYLVGFPEGGPYEPRVQVFDLSSLMSASGYATLDNPINSVRTVYSGGLLRNGDYLYVFGYGGIQTWNISAPMSPTVESTVVLGTVYNLVQHGDYLIATGDGSVHTLDLDDPSSPELVSELDLGWGEYGFAAAATDDTIYVGHFRYTSTEEGTIYTDTLSVIDWTNPISMAVQSTMTVTEGMFHLAILDGYLLGSASESLYLWDISSPTQPAEVASIPADGRTMVIIDDIIVTNGQVTRLSEGQLERIGTFATTDFQGSGFPFFSAVSDDGLVFLAQETQVEIINLTPPRPVFLPLAYRN